MRCSKAERLRKNSLTAGMMKGRQPNEIDDVIAKLSSRDVYFSHGSVIDHVEAANLGLKIEYLKPDDPIWQRIWLLFCLYEHDCRKAGYLKVFEGQYRSTAVALPTPRSRQGHHDFPDADLAARDGLTVERRSGNLLCQ